MKVFNNLLYAAIVFVLLTGTMPDAGASLIGHWTFDEGSGTTAYDSSDNGLDGSIANAVYVDGHIGSNALYFNGSNSYVEVLNNAILVPQTIGISLWFQASNPYYTDYFDILDKGHGYGSEPYYAGYVIQGNVTSDNRLGCGYGCGDGFCGPSTDFSWWNNKWHHLVVNLGQAGCQLYMDGILQDSAASKGPLIQNNSNLYFGRHHTLGRYFWGAIDDIRLYDYALSQSQVNALFVPEPATICLLGIGALSLFRRKK